MLLILPVVTINEVAWMGTESSYNAEWVELYNSTDSPINLEGWILKAADGVPTIKLKGTIPAKDFYLSERSKDYTGALNNKGEKLELYDNSGNLIDSVDASSGWPAGDNETKQTMERKGLSVWQTSKNPGGTPKTENSLLVQEVLRPNPPPSLAAEQKEENQNPRELAAAGEQLPPVKTDLIILLIIAIPLAIFSGIIILMLKKGLK